MATVGAVLLVAAVIAVLRGGRPDRLGLVRLTSVWLVVVAAVVQLTGTAASAWLTEPAGTVAYRVALAGSAVAALAFCLRNLRVAGLPLVALGLLGNALVVGLNGAMPVSPAAAQRAGSDLSAVRAGADPRHEVAGEGTRLRMLGDVVPVPLPFRPEVLSPGDVLVAAGLAQLLVVTAGAAARGRRERPRHRAG